MSSFTCSATPGGTRSISCRPSPDRFVSEGRILPDRGWDFYNGYNVTFRPKQLGTAELFDAHRQLWRRAFAPQRAAARIARGARHLRTGAALMSAAMNGFYSLKRTRGNLPRDMRGLGGPVVAEAPAYLAQCDRESPPVHSLAGDPELGGRLKGLGEAAARHADGARPSSPPT